MTVTISPGATFGGYRVESLVARGGMGVVYRALDISLQRPVALKLIAPELAEDERFRSRFLMGASSPRASRSATGRARAASRSTARRRPA
jgi:serine/threonine protein kinase